MRNRRRPKIAPPPGSVLAVDQHFAKIAEAARHRTLSRLRAERAGPQRTAQELAKLDRWLAAWRQRAPHIAAMNAKE